MLSTLWFTTTAFAAPRFGEQMFFKDWAAACDNRLNCEAVSLNENAAPDERMSIGMNRNAQSGDINIHFYTVQTDSDRYRIMIDGRVADSGPFGSDNAEMIRIKGAEALRLARQIAKGKRLTLLDGAGTELGAISLAGSAGALAHFDRVQNRAGTRTAIVKPGQKNLRAKWLPTPLLSIKKIVPTKRTPDATAIVSLVEGSECKEARFGVTEDSAYSLGAPHGEAKALVLISCGSGAYNFTTVAYIGTENAPNIWRFEPARFDDDRGKDGESIHYLVNSDWSPDTQLLSSFAKGRGLSDCGSGESYVWDGTMFRLVGAFGMEQCRGSMDWLTLWHVEVSLVD